MTDEPDTVTEAELHAFVDGFLDDAATRRVEAWLKDHPERAAEVAVWQAQSGAIRALFSGYAHSAETDSDLVTMQKRPAGWARRMALLAASVALFAAGAAAGIYGQTLLAVPQSMRLDAALETLPTQAKSAFLVYASDIRHPVEVGADQEAHLVTWLGKRLDYKLVAPDLRGQGYSLVGGRLLPVNGKAGAMLMYQDAGGQRLTVLIGRNPQNAETSFRFESAGPVETFYWIDGDIGYAVTGEVGRNVLQAIAEECYRQFDS